MTKKIISILSLVLLFHPGQAQSSLFENNNVKLYLPAGRLLSVEKPILGIGMEVRSGKKMAVSIDYGIGIHLPDLREPYEENTDFKLTSNWSIQRFSFQIKHIYQKVYSQKKRRKWNNKVHINKAKKQDFIALEFIYAPESYQSFNGSFFNKGNESIIFNSFPAVRYASVTVSRAQYVLALVKGFRRPLKTKKGFIEMGFSIGVQKINIQHYKIVPNFGTTSTNDHMTISNWQDIFNGRIILPYLNFNIALGL